MDNARHNFVWECACKSVTMQVANGLIGTAGYCHCKSCQKAVSSICMPVVHVINGTDAFRITSGLENVGSFKVESLERFICKNCGERLFGRPTPTMVSLYGPNTIPGFKFRPTMHWFVGETDVPLQNDGLPRYKYMPTVMLRAAGATDEDIANLRESGMKVSDELVDL